MTKASDVIALVSQTLANQGCLVDHETGATITYKGMGNAKKASLIKPVYSDDEETDEAITVEAEATRLVEEAKAQIRAYQEGKE